MEVSFVGANLIKKLIEENIQRQKCLTKLKKINPYLKNF